VKIEIRAVSNGFVAQLFGDIKNRQIKSREVVAGSVVELVGLIAEHLRKVYGEDR
jgi:hypothetical protein